MFKNRKTKLIIVIFCLIIGLTIIQMYVADRLCLCIKINEAVISSVAVITIIATILGYIQHKEDERNKLLSEYNKIYRNDGDIKSVIIYLISVEDEKASAIQEDPNDPNVIYKREAFLHFIEEIQYLIDKDMLNYSEAYDMFGYYANCAYCQGTQFLSELDEDGISANWSTLRKFVMNYKKYKK